MAVTSGKGGVGKTNLSANLAVLAARAGRRVLLIDADLGLANVDILYGIRPKYHLGDLLEGDVDIGEILAEGPAGVRVLHGGSGVHELTGLDDAQKLRLITALDTLENEFDFVIIDCGAGLGHIVQFFVGAAQEALLVVTPEPTSLTDAYATVKVLSQEASARHFHVVVNPVATEAQAREVYQKLRSVIDRFLDVKATYLGHIPRDENLHRAVMAQRPLVELFPHSPSSRAMAGLADRLLADPVPPRLDGGLKILWQRLFAESSTAKM